MRASLSALRLLPFGAAVLSLGLATFALTACSEAEAGEDEAQLRFEPTGGATAEARVEEPAAPAPQALPAGPTKTGAAPDPQAPPPRQTQAEGPEPVASSEEVALIIGAPPRRRLGVRFSSTLTVRNTSPRRLGPFLVLEELPAGLSAAPEAEAQEGATGRARDEAKSPSGARLPRPRGGERAVSETSEREQALPAPASQLVVEDAGGRIQWEVPSLAPGEAHTVRLRLQALALGKAVREVSLQDPRGEIILRESHTLEVVGFAALQSHIHCPEAPVAIGTELPIRLDLSNTGNADAQGLVLALTPPDGFELRKVELLHPPAPVDEGFKEGDAPAEVTVNTVPLPLAKTPERGHPDGASSDSERASRSRYEVPALPFGQAMTLHLVLRATAPGEGALLIELVGHEVPPRSHSLPLKTQD